MGSDHRAAGRRFLRGGLALALVFCGAQAFSQPPDAPPKSPEPAGSAAAVGSAQPAPDASGAASAAPVTTAAPATPASPRPKVPKAADPSSSQQAALAELAREAQVYEHDARDYRAAMTRIVQHHYQQKKKRVLAALDREIETESKSLREARDEAIRRLEVFVGRYTGANKDKQSTPDAMFRLAALYEERARAIVEATPLKPNQPPPDPDLGPTIALYKRILNEFPEFRDRAGVLYYLGYSLNDVGRLEEAQQVWRSLVCENHFAYPLPADAKDPTRDTIVRLPQDHPPDWWLGWLSRHPEPLDQKRAKDVQAQRDREDAAKRRKKGPPVAEPEKGTPVDDEDVYKNPFPDDCRPVAQVVAPGEQPRYVGEVWWRIGDHHFDEIDPYGGPYNLLRAETAYALALKHGRGNVYDVSLYKLAWTYFKQQRYQTAVEHFVKLLDLTDKREQETGQTGADFRNEAYAYIAASLTYSDFKGPPAGDPYIARNDVFDLYTDPAQIEEAMFPAIGRVQDPALIPQDRKWTIELYKALSFEFKENSQLHNLVKLDEEVLKKWPFHRDAPMIQNRIATTYESLASRAKGEEAAAYSQKALDARGRLVNYVEQPGENGEAFTPEWVQRNKEDPEAIRAAEQLVKGGLRRAAADHTNAALRLATKAQSTPEPDERKRTFQQAYDEYSLAATAWGSYLRQDENADDAYESRYWLADAYTNMVLTKVEVGEIPDEREVQRAQQAARDVRDSNDNDEKLQPAAVMVVKVAQAVVRANNSAHESSGGSRGFPELKDVQTEKYEEEGDKRERAVTLDVPPSMRALLGAFDEYIQRVPLEKEPDPKDPNHDFYAAIAADVAYNYGQFDEAKKRYGDIYTAQCGKTKYGFVAWRRLVRIAALRRDFEASKALAEANRKNSCAIDDADRTFASNLGADILNAAIFKEAYDAFKKAEALPPTAENAAERRRLFEKAAKLYEEGLQVDPGRDEAPEAAINGALAHKQLGNYDRAIAMYELFIGGYGKKDTLDALEKGDEKARDNYAKRVRYLLRAYQDLAEAYILFFDYRQAAQTFEKISGVEREVPPIKENGVERPGSRGFDLETRRNAAQNAVTFYLNIGDDARADATKQRFFRMNPPEEQQAEIEWRVAEGDFKRWDPRAPDRDANKIARLQATGKLQNFHSKWSSKPAGYGYAVLAAGNVAKMLRAGGDAKSEEWCRNTVADFKAYKSVAKKSEGRDGKSHNDALGSVQADFAAECEYREVDARLKRDFDYETGHHRYAGDWTDILNTFDADAKDAETRGKELNAILEYESPRWTVAAVVRRGTLYDSIRTGLYGAREPALRFYSDKPLPAAQAKKFCTAIVKKPTCSEAEIMKALDKDCGNGDEKSCTDFEGRTSKRRLDWQQKRGERIAPADKIMVVSYTEGVTYGQFFRVRTRDVDHAIGRLAYHEDLITDAVLGEYARTSKDPNHLDADGKALPFVYQERLFSRMRKGMGLPIPDQVLVTPSPAVEAR